MCVCLCENISSTHNCVTVDRVTECEGEGNGNRVTVQPKDQFSVDFPSARQVYCINTVPFYFC